MGKTQVATEYGYRYRDDYQAILWVRADSRGTLITSFVNLAHMLNRPEKKEQDQQHVIAKAIMSWLRAHPG